MKKLAFLTLALVAAAGCARGSSDSDSDTSLASSASDTNDTSGHGVGTTRAQLRAFDLLQARTAKGWLWVQHDTFKTPMHLEAPRVGAKASPETKPVLVKGRDAVLSTIDFLSENKDLFKMHDPSVELGVERTEVDEIGMTHARFQQMVHGVPVAGAELMAHYDVDGRVTSIDANYIADIDLDVNPAVTTSDAISMVKTDILATSQDVDGNALDESALEPDEGQLVVFTRDPSVPARLAYRYKVRAISAKEPAIWVTTIDAKTGAILERYNNIQTVQGQGVGVLGDQKTFEVTANGNGFVMTDTSTGVQIRTFTARNQQTTPGQSVTSTTATSWDTGVTGAGAAVDAHANATAVFKYYKDKHARNAIDGVGGALISTAHFGANYDNAFWDSTGMAYGDGGQIFRPLSVSLDVVGHEFTHGVTEKTSALEYQTQSGALNEAVSDIFGAFIEHSVKPDAVKNWVLGENVMKAGGALRDMKNPGAVEDPQPSHMSKFVNTQQDNGGVHINSGIINNAAFLMTVGGANPVSKTEVKFGIGWEKSEKLWYRANTKYFLATTNFGQAAQGVLSAAKDVGLTENEINIVDCAFKATGVAQGTCNTIVDPQGRTPGSEIPGQDGEETGGGPSSTEDDPSTTDDEATDEEEDEPVKPKSKKRRAITQTTGGCSAAPTSIPGELGGVAMLALVAGLALSKRRR